MKKKNILMYILSFLIPFLIFNIVFLMLDISFFSSKNVLTSDMQSQYYPLFTYFKNIFSMKNSIFYSFSNGIGGSMLSTIAYYLSSPFNLLLLLFNNDNLYKGISLLITLKIGLSGLTMYIYLDKKINSKKIFSLLFSICYALMAYNINYYFNVMWLDGVIFAPLILLGIDKILEGKNSLLFGITLFIAVLSNYYIGYMICLFSFIYIMYSIFIKFDYKKEKKIILKYFLRYLFTGIISVLISSFILIPGLLQLTNSNKETMNIFENMFNIVQTPLDIFSKTFIGTHNESLIINRNTVNIYCGLIILPLLFFYIFNKEISKKEKIGFLSILIIFILSVVFLVFNKIWHGFSLPQGFNYRYSFLFCLFFITISYKSLTKINSIKIKQFISFYIIYLLLSLLVIFKVNIDYKGYYIYISMIVMFLYLLLLYSLRKNVKDIIILLVIMTMAELFFNVYTSYKNYNFNNNKIYEEYVNSTSQYISKYNDPNDFYRIEKTYSLTNNDQLLLNYRGLQHFLSTANGNSINFLKNMGLKGHNLSIEYSLNSTEIIDSLLGIKYVFSEDKISYYNKVDEIVSSNNKEFIFENPNYLNLGYMISESTNNCKLNNKVGYEFQNKILNCMLDNDSRYFKEINILKQNNGYIVNDTIDNQQYIYLYIKLDIRNETENVILYLDNNIYKIFNTNENIIRVPITLEDKEISFKLRIKDKEKEYDRKINIKAYTFDTNLFDEDISLLKDEQLNIEYMKKDKIKGRIKVLNDGILFTTIPYEKGFTIYVNGEKKEYKKIFDTFIGIDLKKGNYNIEIIYKTPYLRESSIISLISLTIFILYIKKQNSEKIK